MALKNVSLLAHSYSANTACIETVEIEEVEMKKPEGEPTGKCLNTSMRTA